MADMMDDIAHLSQEIGPRPAGTEEEQQAALYIADELQKSAGFSTVVEDVSCASNGNTVRLVCFTLAFVCTLLSIIFPVLSIPCLLIEIVVAVLFVCEALGKSVLSRFLRNGVSQNVVAKYNPVSITSANKRRKVIVVAHYDSARVASEYQGIVGQYLPIIRLVEAGSLLVAPLILLIKTVFFANAVGGFVVFLTILQVLCLIIMALPLIGIIKRRVSPYNEAANNNAAGVAVLLDVARNVGNGLVSTEIMEENAAESGVRVHGEEAAREADVIPEGAQVEYKTRDHALTPDESLAAAKAAIAALTGKPVADQVPLSDISNRLVRHGEFFDTAEDAAAAAVHFEPENEENAPLWNPTEVNEIKEDNLNYTVVETTRPAEPASVEGEASSESFMRDSVEALQPGATGMGSSYKKEVPAWAKAAQEKAHANKPELMDAKNVSRSRFADAPAAKMTDAAMRRANPAAYVAEEQHEEETPVKEAVPQETTHFQEPESELSKRLAAMREEINDAAAPMLKKVEEVAAGNQAEAAVAAEAPATIAEDEVAVAEIEETIDVEEPQPARSARRSSRRQPAQKNNIGGFLGRASQMVSGLRDVANKRNANEEKTAKSIDLVETVHDDMGGQTTAMPHIDVSHFVAEEQASQPEAGSATAVPVQVEEVATEQAVFTEIPAAEPEPVFVEVPPAPEPTPEFAEETVTVASAVEEDPAPEAVIEEEYVEPVAPIMGMEAMTSVMPVVQQETITTEEEDQPDRHVIVLPDVVAPVADNMEGAKQRAPMAAGLESSQSQSQALLSNMLPQIDSDDPFQSVPAAGGLDLPDFSTADFNAVSATVAAPVVDAPTGAAGNAGSFAEVSTEIIEEVPQDDVYINDADDSVYDEGFTQTGAFAGPDYVEMPKSRVGRLFGRFGKKKKQEEQSIRDWVNVDENYEARSVGRERGGWESFRSEDDIYTDTPYDEFDDAFADDDFDDDRGWNGGAFSLQSLRDRVSGSSSKEPIAEFEEDEFVVTPDVSAPMRAIPEDVKITEEINNEMRRLRDFRHPEIDTEVWFVALGAEEAMNSGMKAFIEEHKNELKGAIIVNLEGVGAGHFSFIDEEGEYRPNKVSSRMKRMLRQASERSGVPFSTNKLLSRNTAAHVAAQHGLQAMTLAGMDGNQTAYYGSINDTAAHVKPETLKQNSRFVLELLKSI